MLVINETSHSKDLQYRAASQYFSKQILHNATLASHLVVVRCIHTVYPCCIHKTHTDKVEMCHLSIHLNVTVSVNGFSSSKSSDLVSSKTKYFFCLFVSTDYFWLKFRCVTTSEHRPDLPDHILNISKALISIIDSTVGQETIYIL